MTPLVAVLVIITVALGALVLGGVFADPITSAVRRRIPNFAYDGESFLIWGLLSLAVLACGTMILYLVTRP